VIKTEKSGFKKIEMSNVILSTGDRLNAGEFVLEVGNVTETVQVTADAGQLLIKTESGERSDLISGQQLRNIGLNGRNAIDLVKIVPGVISGGAASGTGASTVTNITGSFTINGTRNTQHEYTVDGVTNYNRGNNTGHPFANALLGVYTSYLQASTKVKQSYFYQDISWYAQDTYFGEYSAARDPRIIQLAVKFVF
jgi:hypothetical protein